MHVGSEYLAHVVREGFSEEETFELRPESIIHVAWVGKSISDKNSIKKKNSLWRDSATKMH